MDKTLKEKVKEYVDNLTEEIIKLENISGTEARIRRDTLNDVIYWFQVLLNAELRQDFKARTKNKKAGYIQERAEEIFNECNINTTMESYYKLGQSSVYGLVLYMLDKEEFAKSDIKKFIVTNLKDDTQLRYDSYGIWGDCLKNEK